MHAGKIALAPYNTAPMPKLTPQLSDSQREFIAAQRVFFVATAPDDGRVNLSPKGLETFHVLAADRVAYLDLTGSGNESAAHTRQNGRVTLMFCAFEGAPMILRIYGRGRAIRPGDPEWSKLRPRLGQHRPGERQILLVEVESVQTSCGFGVPLLEYRGERTKLVEWAERKGPEGIAAYWAEKNVRSIDDLPTGI
jgi:predicted pyridoxine 5'-phosphate oxidase superfamily flavin-nucleotide-binding protein